MINLMVSRTSRRKGYTLVEVMVILGITAIIGTVAVMNLPLLFRSTNLLDSTADELVGRLILAQQKSVSQTDGFKWGVHLDATTSGRHFYQVFHGDSYAAGTVTEAVNIFPEIDFLSPIQGQTDNVIFERVTGIPALTHGIIIALSSDHSIVRYISVLNGSGLITKSNTVPEQDFSVALSPSSGTVTAGSFITSDLTVTLTDGVPVATGFSANNLPSGVTANFNPLTCTPTCVTSMTLTASALTPGGTTAITISATSGSVVKSRDFILTVQAQTAPSVPQNLNAAAGPQQASLTWQAPASNGGSAVTNYNIYRSTSPGSEVLLSSGSCSGLGNVLSCTDTGLINGITYYYKVSARNIVGEGPLSGEVSATLAAAPSAPQNIATLAVSQQINLYWSVPTTDGGSAITGYKIYRSATSGFTPGAGNLIATVASSPASYSDTGLTNGTVYYYKLSATNNLGEGSYSVESAAYPGSTKVFVTSATYTGNLGGLLGGDSKCSTRATAAGLSGTWKSWLSDSSTDASTRLYHNSTPYTNMMGQKIANNWSGLTGFSILTAIKYDENRSAASSMLAWTGTDYNGLHYFTNNCVNWTSSIATGANAGINGITTQSSTSWTNTGSGSCNSNNSLYCFEQAILPATPSNVSAAGGNANITLTWSSAGADVTNYRIYRGATSGGETLLTEVGNVLNYTDSAVTSGNTYYYKVSAKNYIGEGSQSSEVYQIVWVYSGDASWGNRMGITIVASSTNMWAMGGFSYDTYSYKNDVWYSSNGATWTQATANAGWATRYNHSALVYKNKLWILGGMDGSFNYKNDVWYSSNGATWTQATASAGWSGRQSFGAIVFDGKMWVIGGTGNTGQKNDVWYSTDGVTWTQATASAAWTARQTFAAMVYNGKMWVAGGSGNSGIMNDIWYSTNGATWTQATASAAWTARQSPFSGIFNDRMWVMGGSGNTGVLGDIWSSADGINWTQVTPLASWSYKHSSASYVFNDKLWVAVGNDGYGPTSNVWNINTTVTSPSAPTGLGSTAASGSLTLNWTAPSNGGNAIYGYKIYRSSSSGTETILTEIGNTTSYTDSGLTNGTTYYYKVSAYNSNGEGALSSEISGIPSDYILAKSAVLSSARFLHSCAQNSLTNKIYCFGGYNPSSTYLNQIAEYNPVSDGMTTKSAILPTARYYLACAENSSTHKIYCFGGYGGLLDLNQIVEYDPSTDTRTTMPETLPQGIVAHACAENSSTHKIYCFGGNNDVPGPHNLNAIVEYDPATHGVITKSATLPANNTYFSCVENSSTHKIYCFGGFGDSGNLNTIIEYDPAANIRTTKSAVLPTARNGIACAQNSLTNKIYCFGGYDTGYMNQVTEYNPATDILTIKAATLPSGRNNFSCSENSSTHKIYCFGGYSAAGYLNDIFEYNP